MRPLRPLLVATTCSLLLAGCSDPAPGGGEADGPGPAGHGAHGAADPGSHLLAPTWAVGDWWTMSSPQGGEFTHAVSGETASDWILDTDSPDTAFFDARSDISFLGPVRKSDLAGSQGSDRVEFLRFPLVPHLNWTTTWDGETKSIHVMSVDAGKAMLMAMHANGTMYAHYTYSDKERYFTQFQFFAPNGVDVGFEWTLMASGKDFPGELVRWQVDELLAKSGQLPAADAGPIAVSAGITDVYADIAFTCVTGAATVAVGVMAGPSAGRGVGIPPTPCPGTVRWSGVPAPYVEGDQWGFLIQSTGSPPASAGVFALTVWERTLQAFAPGQAPA